jgi:hypothetical protein
MATMTHCEKFTLESFSPVCSTNQIIDHPLRMLVVIPNLFKLASCHLVTYSRRDFCRSDVLIGTMMHHKEFTFEPPILVCMIRQIIKHPLQTQIVIPNPFKLVLCCLVTCLRRELHQSNSQTASHPVTRCQEVTLDPFSPTA